jgi:WD40 repeat protein
VEREAVIEIGPQRERRAVRHFRQPLEAVHAISPDGRWILTHSRDASGDPMVWSVEQELDPIVLRRVGGALTAAAPSPDGSWVVTGYQDGTIAIWEIDLDPESLKRRLWRCTSYCLTVEERQSLLGEDLETARDGRKSALARVLAQD